MRDLHRHDDAAKQTLAELVELARIAIGKPWVLGEELLDPDSPVMPDEELRPVLCVAILAVDGSRPARNAARFLPKALRPQTHGRVSDERRLLWLLITALAVGVGNKHLDRSFFAPPHHSGGHDSGHDVRLDAWSEHTRVQFFEFAEWAGRSNRGGQ